MSSTIESEGKVFERIDPKVPAVNDEAPLRKVDHEAVVDMAETMKAGGIGNFPKPKKFTVDGKPLYVGWHIIMAARLVAALTFIEVEKCLGGRAEALIACYKDNEAQRAVRFDDIDRAAIIRELLALNYTLSRIGKEVGGLHHEQVSRILARGGTAVPRVAATGTDGRQYPVGRIAESNRTRAGTNEDAEVIAGKTNGANKPIDNCFFTCLALAATHMEFARLLGYAHPTFNVPFDPTSRRDANEASIKAEYFLTVDDDARNVPWTMPDGSYPVLVTSNFPYSDEKGKRRARAGEIGMIQQLRAVELEQRDKASAAGVDQHLVDLLPYWPKRNWFLPVIGTATAILHITDPSFHFWNPRNPKDKCFTDNWHNYFILYTGSRPDLFAQVYGKWGYIIPISAITSMPGGAVTTGTCLAQLHTPAANDNPVMSLTVKSTTLATTKPAWPPVISTNGRQVVAGESELNPGTVEQMPRKDGRHFVATDLSGRTKVFPANQRDQANAWAVGKKPPVGSGSSPLVVTPAPVAVPDAPHFAGTNDNLESAREPIIITFDPQVIQGDCLDILKRLPSNSVDLIATSPPYGMRRKSSYGGIDPDHYVEWFLPRAAEMFRVLREGGSFVLNLKTHIEHGEEHPYVDDLTRALRQQGWRRPNTFHWVKKNCYPCIGGPHLPQAYEPLYHFSKGKPHFFHDAVKPPSEAVEQWMERRDITKPERKVKMSKAGFGNLVGNKRSVGDKAFPTDVIVCATAHVAGHTAPFPIEIPEFCIKLLTQLGNVVVDPFSGSGTTGIASVQQGRKFLGIEKKEEYVALARRRIAKAVDVAANEVRIIERGARSELVDGAGIPSTNNRPLETVPCLSEPKRQWSHSRRNGSRSRRRSFVAFNRNLPVRSTGASSRVSRRSKAATR